MEAPVMRSLLLSLFTLVSIAVGNPVATGHTVSIVASPDLAAPARHGVERFEAAVHGQGWEVKQAASVDTAGGDVIVVAALAEAAKALPSAPALGRPLDTPEALAVRKFSVGGRPAVLFAGADARGLMYALLDAAEGIADAAAVANPADLIGAIRNAMMKK